MIIMNKISGHTNQCLKQIEKLTNVVIKWINIASNAVLYVVGFL